MQCELADSAQETDSFGHKRLTGTALFLAEECNRRLGIKTRAIELSTLQRCAAHLASLADVTEAYEAGMFAMKSALDGENGVVVIFKRPENSPYRCEMDVAPAGKICNNEKGVPLAWIDEENACMREEFLSYVKPLVQGEASPAYKDGLPCYLHKI